MTNTVARRVISTRIAFLGLCDGKPVYYGRQRHLDNLPLEPVAVTIEDARSNAPMFSLEREGFELVPHRSSTTDFSDPVAVREVYLRELEHLIQTMTGAVKTVAMPGGVRRRSERSPQHRKDGTTVLGRFAHCDFSPNPAGSSAWVEQLLSPRDSREWLRRRFAIFTVWRVLTDPPQDTPLALCDARSVNPEAQVCSDCVADPEGEPECRFENSVFRHHEGQRWYYFSDMTPNEVLVFKGFDSDTTRRSAVPHAAFDDPTCPRDAPPRESIDQRVIAFY